MEHLKDWRGNDIEPGSLIVYPGRHSSSMWMVEAEVLEWVEITSPYSTWETPVPALRVQPLRQGRYGQSESRVDKKPVTLTALERVTVVGHVRDLEKSNAHQKRC